MIRTRQEYTALKATEDKEEWGHLGGQDLPAEGKEKELRDPALIVPGFDDPPVEILSDSDSSDFEHIGNDTPCRFYNHEGCKYGSRCRFKHAPTKQKTTRDELFVFASLLCLS